MTYCNSCRQTPCGCGSLPCVPQPSYNQAPFATQNHAQQFITQEFNFGVTFPDMWVIPLINGTAQLSVPGIASITVGGFLWHEEYGYFKVSSANVEEQKIGVTNLGFSGNKPPGTTVPACTTFLLAPPPCCEDINQSGLFLKLDFTAPAEGTCIPITLTGTTGITGGDLLQIGTTAKYRVSDVNTSTNVVTICNDGDGFPVGAPVIAQDAAGQYQYPVNPIEVNPCARAQDTTGIVQVCVNGNQGRLNGTAAGYLLTLADPADGRAEYRNTIPAAISSLTTQLSDLNDDLTALGNYVAGLKGFYGTDLSENISGTINSGNTQLTSDTATVIIDNDSVRTCAFHYTVISRVYGNADNANVDDLQVDMNLELNINGAGFAAVVNQNETLYVGSDNPRPMDRQRVWNGINLRNPGDGFTIDARTVVTWQGSGTSAYIIDNVDVEITVIAVPLA